MIRRRLFFIFLVFTSYSIQDSLLSQGELEQESAYSITQFDSDNGLPQNQVLDIIYDKKGVLVSTFNGIARFDGNEFFPYSLSLRSDGLAISEMYLDTKSETLFGWDLKGRYYQIDSGYKVLGHFNAVFCIKDTMAGISEDGLLERFSYNYQEKYEELQTHIRRAGAISKYRDLYYIGSKDSLYQFDARTKEKKSLLAGDFGNVAKDPYSNKIIAVANYTNYYYVITPNKIEKYPLFNDLEIERIDKKDIERLYKRIEFISKDEFFIASNLGLHHVLNNKVRSINLGQNTPCYSLLYVPEQACLLVGTENKGVLSLQKNKVKTYFVENREGSQSFQSVVKDKENTIYSTAQGFLLKLKDGSSAQTSSASLEKSIVSLALIREHLYVGTWGDGLYILKKNQAHDSINFNPFEKEDRDIDVRGVFEDSQNNRWLCSSLGVFLAKEEEEFKIVVPTEDYVTSIYELKNGNLVFGAGRKVFFINKDGVVLKTFDERDGMAGREIRSYYEDKKGRLWIGTYGGGLFVYEHDKLTSINKMKNCQLSLDVFTLLNYKGTFYMSSNRGLWSIKEEVLYGFYEGKYEFLVPSFHGKKEGLNSLEFNGGFQNNALEYNDKLYFPSINGLVEFRPYEDRHKPSGVLYSYFKSITINDTLEVSHLDAKNAVFNRDLNSFRFHFYCLSINEGYNIHYQYRLIKNNGFSDWSNLQKPNTVELRMLGQGKYNFQVRAINSSNNLTSEVTSYSFEIKPYFYETDLFLILIIFVLILIVLQYVRIQNRRSQVENTMLELKLKMIQSKLDPHFIFNSLNNVFYLLSIEKYQHAEEFLEEFSLLLREYVEKSDEIMTTLGIELNILNLYLSIQNKRFNKDFDYYIDCPKELYTLNIPTTIIQPFVENSIIHGLAHSTLPGLLSIVIRKEKNTLLIKIEDNGIGRYNSRKINRHRKNHNSRGLDLVYEKIHFLEKKFPISIKIDVIDIKEDGKTGTIVLIKITYHD